MKTARIKLMPRDLELLNFLSEKKAAPLDVLAKRYFTHNPRTGAPNAHPLRACARRIETLIARGYLKSDDIRERPRDGQTRSRLIMLDSKGAKKLAVKTSRVHARHKDHQIVTMRVCEDIRARMLAEGMPLVTYQLEHEKLAHDYANAPSQKGKTYDPFADASVTVEARDGTVRTFGIEYVTKGYTDSDIVSKHRGFQGFDDVVWVADNRATALRVSDLIGVECRAK